MLSFGAIGQNDTEFWFAAPDNTSTGGGIRQKPINLLLTSFNNAATVTISQPANPAFAPIVISLSANFSQKVLLEPFLSMIECQPANTILNFGLKINATNPITAYYEQSSQDNPDIYTLKGRNALGTDFIIPAQRDFANSTFYNPRPKNSFCMVATHDNTSVTITPSRDVVGGHTAGVPFTITLNTGQTFACEAVGSNPDDHLAGSIITSDKPIAVSISDDSVTPTGGAPDLCGDQIIPESLYGSEYIVVNGALSIGSVRDRVYIFAKTNGTQIFRDGNATPVATINRGNFYSFQFDASDVSTYINSSEPVLVYHISGFNQQPGGAVIPPIECTGSNQIAFTRSTVASTGPVQFLLMISTRAGNQGGFTLNGDASIIKASDFTPVPGTSNQWYAAKKDLTNVVLTDVGYILSNSLGLFHCGLVNGSNSNSCRYGYFSSFATVNLGPDQTICPGDSLLLDAGAGKDTYLWYPDGQTTHSIWVKTPGTYYVDVTDYMCSMSDTLILDNYTVTPINLGNDTSICINGTITLDAGTGFKKYSWSTGEGTQTITVPPGVYTIIAEINGGCNSTDTITIGAHPIPPQTLIKHN
ncbi:MAG TPA: hypothetical protein DEO70_06115 [Bacteroidales bacterium]|nr:MAG: hypothetical protein A2X11_03775 [Bacteroidetes bacterium GWE2_42_24]OFY29792.1 MAG: hypothetical protein A2X09_13090 [Bacteroidetes bacterium GWF2_43_11]HBZ66397.1 hypothetical protein [Bacteroidales bacterium]